MSFVHLHAHSEYSIADGLFSPKKWASAYRERGFIGAALTDHGVMGGVLPFYYAMKKEGIVPILGMEAYFNYEPEKKDNENRRNMHLVLLAKNYEGLRNLYRLSHLAFTKGYYYRPRIGPEWLAQHSEGLVCLSACMGGPLSVAVYRDEENKTTAMWPNLHDAYTLFDRIFEKDFYVEFQGHAGEQSRVNKPFYEELVKGRNAQYIITNDNHYIKPEHAKVQGILKAAAYGNSDAAKSFTEEYDGLWMKNESEVTETFKMNHDYLVGDFIKIGIERTVEVFEKCKDLELPEGKNYLPKFRPKIDSAELFKKLTLKKLKDFVAPIEETKRKAYVETFKKEFGVITKYGLQDYFLIVWDLVRFCDKHGIYVGLGRGSAAGCLISYILGIVRIDPLKFDLYFERFLNPIRCETGELPDIDLDFESLRRQEVKDYVLRTYGQENVCEIGTYGTMQLKTSILDFGKAMNIANHRQLLDITTKLDSNTLEEAYGESDALARLCDRNIDFVEAVEAISGQLKSQGIHPAGLIVSPEPIHTLTALKTQKTSGSKERVIATQGSDKHIIAQGFMKLDILGVKQYDIVKYAIENSNCPLTRENYVEEIDYTDEKVWATFQKGQTDGVFQFGSDGMQELLVNMVPEAMGDLIAANALYRPGCLRNGWHDDYCDRKNGEVTKWDTIHPIFAKITKDTYGILVYQEQVMAIINQLGGIPLADSDIIRSALGKKIEDKLKVYGPQFIDGASKHIDRDKAEKLWEQIMFSSEYNFNKSHSAAYSVLAYVSQWLKIYYTSHFWAACCDWGARKNKTEEMIKHMTAGRAMGVDFKLPNISRSKSYFYAEDEDDDVVPSLAAKTVQMAFTAVKGLGFSAATEIEANSPFSDFEDFYLRVNKSKVKVNNIVSLIHAGAFDEFGDKAELYRLLYDKRTAKQQEKMIAPSDMNYAVGFYESMGFFEQKIKENIKFDFSRTIFTEKELRDCYDTDGVVVGGMISAISIVTTKKGDKMAFATLVDNDENIKLTIFPDYWGSLRSHFKIGNIVEAAGTKTTFGGSQNAVQVNEIKVLGVL